MGSVGCFASCLKDYQTLVISLLTIPLAGWTAWNLVKQVRLATEGVALERQKHALMRRRDKAALVSLFNEFPLLIMAARDELCGEQGTTQKQQKTGRPVQFEITSDTRASLLDWLGLRDVAERSMTSPFSAG
jgi:hypothetical protein